LYKAKSRPADKLFIAVIAAVLTTFAFICVYPFYYIFIGSISSPSAISKGVFLLPSGVNIKNYMAIFKTPGIGHAALISLARTIIGTALAVIFPTFVAYIFTYKEIPCRKILYRFFIITMYLNAGFVPFYVLISDLKMLNTFWIYVIPGAVSAYFIILTRAFMESLPDSLREAAEIDGAGILRIFLAIVLPLCKPILACLAVFAAVGQWNAWADTLYYVHNANLFPLQYLLYKMLQNNMADAMRATNSASAAAFASQQMTPAALRLTMTFVTTVPILLIYPFMQRYFIKGMLLGAVKG